MTFCVTHWNALRAAISVRGLDKFISKDGPEAAKRAADSQDPTVPREQCWDPLLNASIAIWSNALEQGGPYLLGEDPDGNSYCALCELDKSASIQKSGDWVRMAADEQLGRAREYGFISGETIQ